jgi:hypothetical protein
VSYHMSLMGANDRLIQSLDSMERSSGASSASASWSAVDDVRSMDGELEMQQS